MLKNYLITIIRNMAKQKSYAFINVFGLSLGMASCILIFIWVKDELSVNTMHQKADSIYLVRTWQQYGSNRTAGNGTPPALGPALKEEYPEIINAVRFNNGKNEFLMQYSDKKFKERIQFSDPSAFEIFSLPLLSGSHIEAYNDPHVIILSEEIAKKYFEGINPVGQFVILDNQYHFKVIAVMKNIPEQSTIDFHIWVPISFMRETRRPDYIDTWYNLSFRTYVELEKNISIEEVNTKIKDRIKRSDSNTILEPFLYPFRDIYLKLWGNQNEINIFSLIAIFILSIACINFMNLATARSAGRAREVGLRKVVGAARKQIMKQFFGESFIYSIFAMIMAILLVELFLPGFRELTNSDLKINILNDSTLLMGILGIVLLTGVMAGTYPAIFLSSFKPVSVLSGSIGSGARSSVFRKVLVVIQFTLSIILIIATLVIYRQTQFVKNKQLGFNKDNLIYIPIQGNLKKSHLALKHELLQQPEIINTTVSSHSPTGVYWNGQDWNWESKDPNINPLISYIQVDYDFLESFEMKMSQGSFFSKEISSKGNVVINESLAKIIGADSPIGMRLSHNDDSYQVIGVIKDFHYKPVYWNSGPLIMYAELDRPRFKYMFIKITSKNIRETIENIKAITQKYNPDFPFEYRFLDQDYERMYRWIERTTDIYRAFAFLAILISCLGLFGLASFMVEQRTKEIGVRKVLGATIPNVIILLSKEYAKWILIANFIAWPVAYFYMSNWLQDFAYRTNLGISIFIIAAMVSILIAFLTVGYQSIKAAISNPVEALRYE